MERFKVYNFCLKLSLLILVALTLLPSCTEVVEENENEDSPDVTTERIIYSLPKIEGVEKTYLKNLDSLKFPDYDLKNIAASYEWGNLEQIIENPREAGFDVRALATLQSPYPHKFNLYIFGIDEGGDCGPAYTLVTEKEGLELASRVLGLECGWENGQYQTTSYFINLTTFLVTSNGRDRYQDSTGYVMDKTSKSFKLETYVIKENGAIELTDKVDSTWVSNEAYEYR